MRRAIGLTARQRHGIVNFDRLSVRERVNLAYDVRAVLTKELDDLHWLLTATPSTFRRHRGSLINYPLEPMLPTDSHKLGLVLSKVDDWIKTLELIRAALESWGTTYFRMGRL